MASKPAEDDDFSFEIEDEVDGKSEIEVVDDTPEADRGREPMPKDIVEELESDELEDYSDKVKTRLKQMKKVWHDERREKERVLREQQEALSAAQRLLEENRRLRSMKSTQPVGLTAMRTSLGTLTRSLTLKKSSRGLLCGFSR
jgi:hypothetical protein